MAEITPLFSAVETKVVNLGITGWPLAPSRHFREVANHVAANYPHDAWYFFEADNTPLCEGWLAQFDRAFIASGKAFMGRIVPTRGWSFQADGRRVPQMGEPHMVGTGIYHPSFAKKSVRLGTIDRHMPWVQGPPEPFDIALRHEIVPFACNTPLIQHNWQTQNYRVEEGKLVCSDTPEVSEGTSHAATWDGESIVIHGCKDGSLAELILAGKFPAKQGKQPEAPPVVVSAPLPVINSTGVEKPPLASFLAHQAKQAVETSATRFTAKGLAKKLNVSLEKMLATIDEPGSGLKVAGVPKWVSLS